VLAALRAVNHHFIARTFLGSILYREFSPRWQNLPAMNFPQSPTRFL
jgi:hypothetical protein